ncbi:MAG: hypothetical protein IKP98_03945 [Bacilli bacterium]|nr:hypothetical protein [Bacilli bacterium]
MKGERNLDDYSVDLGSYLFTDINDMPFVEVITGTPFSCYFTKESHNQMGVPFLKLVMDICVKGHDTLLVDEDHQIKLFGNDIYEEFNRQNSIGFEELSNRFASLEKEYKPEGDSSDVKGGLTKKPSTKKGEKE